MVATRGPAHSGPSAGFVFFTFQLPLLQLSINDSRSQTERDFLIMVYLYQYSVYFQDWSMVKMPLNSISCWLSCFLRDGAHALFWLNFNFAIRKRKIILKWRHNHVNFIFSLFIHTNGFAAIILNYNSIIWKFYFGILS